MRNLSFLLFITVLALGVVSCGNKDKDSSATTRLSSDPYRPSTVEGYLDVVQPTALIANVTYQISQNSFPVMNQAWSTAQQQGVQPVMINGSQKFKARITGSIQTATQQTQPNQPNQQYPQQSGNILNVTQVVIHN